MSYNGHYTGTWTDGGGTQHSMWINVSGTSVAGNVAGTGFNTVISPLPNGVSWTANSLNYNGQFNSTSPLSANGTSSDGGTWSVAV